MPSHEIFWNIKLGAVILYPLAAVVVGVLVYAVYKRYRLWRLGQGAVQLGSLWRRILAFIKPAIVEGFAHKRILREPYPGIMHLLIFWGAIIFLLGAFLDFISHYWFHFMEGTFYVISSLVIDIFGLLVLIGVIIAAYRRYVQRPDRLDNTPDDAIALLLIFLVVITGFLVEGFRIAAPEPAADSVWAIWSPGGFVLAQAFSGLALSTKLAWHAGLWWFHVVLALGAIAYVSLSFSKLSHILVAPANVFLRPLGAKGALTPIDIETTETLGVGNIEEFSWKELLDLDACTRCGRCQDNCPAYLSGKPLSPKKVIQDLKTRLEEKGGFLFSRKGEANPGRKLIGEVILEDEIWACTTCRACQEQCPVSIQHILKIVEMRRNLTLMESKMPEAAQLSLSNMQKRGHPWVGSQYLRLRDDWTKEVEVKLLTEDSDVDTLLWVGCTGALADRNVLVTIALVKVLTKAGVNFVVLGGAENCCGDPARRLGYELLYEELARQNIEVFHKHNIKRIITPCPHCFNTIKHEYPQFGGEFEVWHHTEFIADLLQRGKLNLAKRDDGTLTYHDACYLGRYNDIYEAPRQIVRATNGNKLVEMARKRERSFCCGGGGGHMWLEEQIGKRINEMRIEHAVATGAETVVTACPYCLQMLENGLEGKGLKESMKIRDVVELVAEAATCPEP